MLRRNLEPVVVHHVTTVGVRVLVLTGDLETPHHFDLYRQIYKYFGKLLSSSPSREGNSQPALQTW